MNAPLASLRRELPWVSRMSVTLALLKGETLWVLRMSVTLVLLKGEPPWVRRTLAIFHDSVRYVDRFSQQVEEYVRMSACETSPAVS